ncbi:MAG: dihydrofolate reductase [Chitinophagaceae bacterium]|nr:dihydrofolate reductase [Chitinophagaceae bacterium]
MGKLSTFNFISLDGYYKDANDGISWHPHDEEGTELSIDSLKNKSTLLFGRKTYEMMASFWPGKDARTQMPEVAAGMNKAEKIVFSTTMTKADWNNTTLIKGNLTEEIKKMKQGDKNMTILGSGSIISQLAKDNLIDEYLFLLDPIAIGKGTSLFNDLTEPLNLKLITTQPFKSGAVLLTYQAC